LPHSAIDLLAQEVDMPIVPGVLLDHVHQDPPQSNRATSLAVPGDLEIRRLGDELVRDATSSRHVFHASATTSGSGTAPSKSPSGSVWE
jgi:hypothetical protein